MALWNPKCVHWDAVVADQGARFTARFRMGSSERRQRGTVTDWKLLERLEIRYESDGSGLSGSALERFCLKPDERGCQTLHEVDLSDAKFLFWFGRRKGDRSSLEGLKEICESERV